MLTTIHIQLFTAAHLFVEEFFFFRWHFIMKMPPDWTFFFFFQMLLCTAHLGKTFLTNAGSGKACQQRHKSRALSQHMYGKEQKHSVPYGGDKKTSESTRILQAKGPNTLNVCGCVYEWKCCFIRTCRPQTRVLVGYVLMICHWQCLWRMGQPTDSNGPTQL